MISFDIYQISGSKHEETESTFLTTVYSTHEAINFVNSWLAGKDYKQSSKDYIKQIIALENTDEHIIRDSAVFKIAQYTKMKMKWVGLRLNMKRDN